MHYFFHQKKNILLAVAVIAAIVVATLATLAWIVLIPLLSIYFRANSILAFVLFAPVWIIGAAAAVDEGFLSGNHKFEVIGVILVAEAVFRFIFTYFLVSLGLGAFVYAATPAALFVAFLIGWAYASRIKGDSRKVSLKRTLAFPTKFLVTSAFAKISIVAFLSLDLILAKHFLTPEEAGKYAILSLAGKMIYFVGSLFSQFITPVVSKEDGRGVKNNDSFNRIFLLSIVASGAAYTVFGLLGSLSAPILFGQKAAAIISYLPVYGLAMLLFTISSSVVLFHQTRRLNVFPFGRR